MTQIALLKYVCHNVEVGFVFYGNTTQTIARGVNLRLEHIQTLFYTKFVLGTKGSKYKGKVSDKDELAGFEEAWKGKNMGQLPGWKGGYDMHSNQDSSGAKQNTNQVWSLPSWEQAGRGRGFRSNYEMGADSSGRTKKVVMINIE